MTTPSSSHFHTTSHMLYNDADYVPGRRHYRTLGTYGCDNKEIGSTLVISCMGWLMYG